MNKTSYQQGDSKWGGLGYPRDPYFIRNCGCGEVAISNVLIELNKYVRYTPKTIQPYMKQFAESHGNGTFHYGIPTALKHYGFTDVKEHGTMNALWKELEKGDRVAVYLMGSRNGGSKKVHWTGSGHFVASVSYKKQNGKHYVYMKDSASTSSLRTGWITYEENIRGACLKVWTGKLPDAQIDSPALAPVPGALVVDGIGGAMTVRATQKFFGIPQDGTITGQDKKQKQFYPALTAVTFAKNGSSPTVKELQKWVGVKEIDGVIGKGTVAAWQKKLKDAKYYTGIIDGYFGVMSMKAWQSFLNDHPKKTEKIPEVKNENPTSTPTTNSTPTTSSTSTTVDDLVIDVSFNQKKIDWDKVKKAGVKGAIIRCGFRGYESGKLQEDSMFLSHIKGAHKAGIKIGVYFFTEGINAKEGKEEAEYTVKLIKKAGIRLDYPVAIDTEYINAKNVRANNLTASKRTEVIKAFCDEMIRLGYRPMIYASLNWFYNNLNMSKLPYDIWCAQYYKKCQYKSKYIMWQYTSEGKISGVDGVVDLNHCYISKVEHPAQRDMTDSKESKESMKDEVVKKMNAWAKKIAGEKYHYLLWDSKDTETHTCPICKGRKYNDNFGWNCIGFAFAVWHHGGKLPTKCNCHVISDENGEKIANAKTDAEALKLAQKLIGTKDIKVIRNGNNNIAKGKWQAGDIGLMFSGNTYKHMFYIMGNGKIADSSRRGSVSDNIAVRNDTNYTARVIIRFTGWDKLDPPKEDTDKKTYPGTLPSTKLVKTNAEVIADAVKWLKWIAGNNDFHYGHGPEAHHNGCYFCKTQPNSKKNAGIKEYEHTYCCNPLIGAAWAHGGCVPAALKLCQKGSSWDFAKGKGYDASKLFDNLGKPSKSKLKMGDVLCNDHHVAMYIGDGKLIEASGGDDNKPGSDSWKKSIAVKTLTDDKYASFKRVHRFNSKVDTTASIRHGEVSKRVEYLQKFLKWYGYDIAVDGIFGDGTLSAVKKFQKSVGITADGIVGPNTISKMKKVVK